MKVRSAFSVCTLALVMAGLLTSQVAFGAGPNTSNAGARSLVKDVGLQEGNAFSGQVVNQQGAAIKSTEVLLLQEGKVVAFMRTNGHGEFRFAGLRAGVYQLETPQGGGVYRLWAPQTAPPSAVDAVLIAAKDNIVRGNNAGPVPVGPPVVYEPTYMEQYGPAIRGAVAGGLIVGGVYWALDYNPTGS